MSRQPTHRHHSGLQRVGTSPIARVATAIAYPNSAPLSVITQALPMDLLALSIAPMRGGAGPYLAFYFATQNHWGASKIGALLALMSLCFGLAQIPAGMIADCTDKHRVLVGSVFIALIFSCLVVLRIPTFGAALCAEAVIGVACAFFTPVMASLSLRLAGRDGLSIRLGRNEIFSNVGNVLAGGAIGLSMCKTGCGAIIMVLLVSCASGIIAALILVDGKYDIEAPERKAGSRALLQGMAKLLHEVNARTLTVCALLYSFANAAMLPLMIQVVSRCHHPPAFTLPAALLVTELIMIPVCAIASRKAQTGRKPLLIASFLLLSLRGLSFSVVQDPNVLVGLQVLDGMSAGIFGLTLTLVVADLTQHSGKLNSTLCSLTMLLTGANAASDFVCGQWANRYGFTATFTTMALIAVAGCALLSSSFPETAPLRKREVRE